MAAAAGSFVDRTVETKGLDYIDREKAKREGEFALRYCALRSPLQTPHTYDPPSIFSHCPGHRPARRRLWQLLGASCRYTFNVCTEEQYIAVELNILERFMVHSLDDQDAPKDKANYG